MIIYIYIYIIEIKKLSLIAKLEIKKEILFLSTVMENKELIIKTAAYEVLKNKLLDTSLKNILINYKKINLLQ